jgi:hypothetical protein
VDCCGLTKRWSLYVASTATPGSRLDLPAGRNQSLLTDSMRAVASEFRYTVCIANDPKAPLRATRSKSQPPHLVFEYFYYCLQNLSSDHLLSGVSADYYETRVRVNREKVVYPARQCGRLGGDHLARAEGECGDNLLALRVAP